MADTTGMADLRKENVSKIVTGFALQNYRLLSLCMLQKSSSWTESYYIETAADLTGGTGSAVKGVPRLASFPYGEVSWTKASSRQVKHGMEGVISWEDAKTNNVDVIARTLLRVARAVSKSVDDEIYSRMSSLAGNTEAIAGGSEWDAANFANRDPIQNILDAMKEISVDNYDPYSGGHLLVSPKDFANLLGNANVRNAGQFYTSDVTRNGRVGRLLGLNVIVSNSVTADEAMVAISKEAVTWQEAQPLTVETITDPGIKYTIRAYQVGTCQVKNPNALCKITGTQA